VPGTRPARGLLDTSVVIALDAVSGDQLPMEQAISTVTMAELATGPHATDDPIERARRQEWLQRVEEMMEPLPLDVVAARAYGRIYAAVRSRGRRTRGRSLDLLIAATALANDLPLYTGNPGDLAGADDLIEIHPVDVG